MPTVTRRELNAAIRIFRTMRDKHSLLYKAWEFFKVDSSNQYEYKFGTLTRFSIPELGAARVRILTTATPEHMPTLLKAAEIKYGK